MVLPVRNNNMKQHRRHHGTGKNKNPISPMDPHIPTLRHTRPLFSDPVSRRRRGIGKQPVDGAADLGRARDGSLMRNENAVGSCLFQFQYALLIHIVVVANEVPALTRPIDIIDDFPEYRRVHACPPSFLTVLEITGTRSPTFQPNFLAKKYGNEGAGTGLEKCIDLFLWSRSLPGEPKRNAGPS